jgi:hypothetical protein
MHLPVYSRRAKEDRVARDRASKASPGVAVAGELLGMTTEIQAVSRFDGGFPWGTEGVVQ